MKRSVIYSHGGGRLGNQLLNHAHLLAFEKEHEDVMRVTNVSFYKYFELYDNHNIVYYGGTGNSIIDLLVKQARLARVYDGPCGKYAEYLATFLLHGIASIGLESQSIIARGHYNGIPGKRVRRINFDDLSDVKKVFSRNITVLAGWECRGWNILRGNKEYVVSKMSISHKYLAIAQEFINKIRDRFDLVVGVFIRRGDYRVWEGGKYFMDPSVYKDICIAIRDRTVGEKVAFVVASDEAQDGFFTEEEFIPATGIKGGSVTLWNRLPSCLSVTTLSLLQAPSAVSLRSWVMFRLYRCILGVSPAFEGR